MKNIIKKIFAILAIIPILGIASENELRIGYQKSDPVLVLLKHKGYLEKDLAPLGVKVSWTEFPAGPQLLEGLNVGSVDFGIVGETPPIFAQAANARITYIGYKPASPKAEAIIVQENSKIKTIADLKGKKIVLNKGSNVHYLLVKALESAGLKYSDVNPVFLPPSDARAAFENGSVDAWVIWDPFLAAAELKIKAKIIKDGTSLVNNYIYYVAEESYAKTKPNVISVLFNNLRKIDKWLIKEPKETSTVLSKINGLDVKALEKAFVRSDYDTNYLNDEVVKNQQKVADTFYDLKLIPKKLDIKSIVWIPENKK